MSQPETPAANWPLPDSARIPLTDQIIVRVSGPGTDKFLQGQFSQQVTDVTEHYSPRAAACSPKGRAYCLTRMVRAGDDVLLALPRSLAEETMTHLRKYLMLFRGTSMVVDTQAAVIGLLGPLAANALSQEASGQLAGPGDTLTVSGGHLIRTMATAEGVARFEFWHTGELASNAEEALGAVPEASLAVWHASEIAAGVPSLGPGTRDSFVPQMLNWQHLGGVHFKKGCYTGQEVIARMHFLGQLKKSLFRFSGTATDGVPAPGTALENHGRGVGEVVNSILLSDGSFQCLAVVRHDSSGSGLTVRQVSEQRLTQLPLPYGVPEREPETGADT